MTDIAYDVLVFPEFDVPVLIRLQEQVFRFPKGTERIALRS